jgi:hypothetical protein
VSGALVFPPCRAAEEPPLSRLAADLSKSYLELFKLYPQTALHRLELVSQTSRRRKKRIFRG